ncbi:hypothetical protein EI94DRAFT_1704317 [Lactarius quietus]|nr:hypothetical protein EI94DRAFT_1704317 [Lactarius quietus]
MVQHPLLLSRLSKPTPRKWNGDELSPLRPCKCHRSDLSLNGNDREQCLYLWSSGDHSETTKHYQAQMGMLDIPPELLLIISAYMDHHDLQAFSLTSRFLSHLLLPEYLRGRGLTLKDTDTGGNAQEARRTIGFVTRFLLNSSNTSHLRTFHYSLSGSNLLLIMPELIKIQELYCDLPLTRLHISGFGSASYVPPSIPLRSGRTCGSRTLTSLVISSDHAFTPGSVRTTLGILNQSPLKSLVIFMVSLTPSQWSTLFGQLNMSLLEDIEVKGDIPWPALLRFLIKHKSLKSVRIAGTSDPSSLHELHVELSQLHPHDPLFHDLLKALRRFQKLNYLGLRLVPSGLSAIPQDTICAYIRSFPMLEVVHVAEGGATVRTELLESLHQGNSTLQVVTVSSGSVHVFLPQALITSGARTYIQSSEYLLSNRCTHKRMILFRLHHNRLDYFSPATTPPASQRSALTVSVLVETVRKGYEQHARRRLVQWYGLSNTLRMQVIYTGAKKVAKGTT